MLFKKSEEDLCEFTWSGFQDILVSFLSTKEYKHLCKKGKMKEWSRVEKNRRWESNTTLSLPFYIILTLDTC